jgi:hypothetical protein
MSFRPDEFRPNEAGPIEKIWRRTDKASKGHGVEKQLSKKYAKKFSKKIVILN